MHHLDGAGFALGWESAVHVGLAESVTEITIGGGDTATPAGALLFGARERVGEEVKVLVDDRFGEIGRGAVYHLPAKVGLPMIKRLAVDQLSFGAEEVGRSHNVVIAGGSVYGFEVTVPIDGGCQGANLRQTHLVIDV